MDAIRIATPEDFCLGTIVVVKKDCLLLLRWRFDRDASRQEWRYQNRLNKDSQ